MLVEIFSIIAPVFLIAATGFTWARMGYDYDTVIITRLLVNITTPCLVFSRLTELAIPVAQFGNIAAMVIGATAIWAVVGYGAIRFAGISTTTGLAPIMFPNAGNMGLALCLFAFGNEGLALGLCFFVTTAVMQFTLSPWVASGRFSLGTMVRSPIIYATGIAVAVLMLGLPVPGWLANTTRVLGDVSIPMMLMTLGVSLASYGVSNLRNSVIVSALRLGLGFGTGLLFTWWFGLDGVTRGVILIMCSMPPAVFNYLFAKQYGENGEEVAGTVIISTITAFALLPFLLAFALN